MIKERSRYGKDNEDERRLQAGTMNDLEIDSELTAIVIDDKDTNTATASLESFCQAAPEVGLIDDWNGLLNITGLGHGDNSAILEIKNTVLLKDRAEHGLDDDTWAWAGDER